MNLESSQETTGGSNERAALTKTEWPIHPLCAMFPDLPPDELQELAGSIKADGQQELAVIHDGQLLDGKNRQVACKLAGKTLNFKYLEPGVDPARFVFQRNLLRRHLTSSQRATIGVEIKSYFSEEAAKRMKAGKALDPSANLRQGMKASEEAAQLVKVSPRLIEAAEHVKKKNPDLFREVVNGEKTVHAAIKELPKPNSLKSPQAEAKKTNENLDANFEYEFGALDRLCTEVVAAATSLLKDGSRSQRSRVRSRLNELRAKLEGLYQNQLGQ